MTAPTTTPSLTREQLLQVAAQNRTYEFLFLADQYLRVVPDDAEMRLQQIGAYARIGLSEIALHAASQLPAALQANGVTDELTQRLQASPQARRSWDGLRPQFERNLSAWASRGGDATAIERAWQAGGATLELYACHDGNLQVCRRDDNGAPVWLPRLMDHQKAVQDTALPPIAPQTLPPPFLVEGVMLGGVLTRLWSETRETFLTYQPALYVIEPNALAAAVAMHLCDWTALLADPRVLLYVGPEAGTQWAAQMQSDMCWPLPGHTLRLLRWGLPTTPSLDELSHSVSQGRGERLAALHAEVRAVFDPFDAAHWAARYAAAERGEALRVLLVTSRYTTFLQYSTRDIGRALESAGHDVRIMMERDDHAFLSHAALLETLRDFRPDMFLILDHLRYEYGDFYPPTLPFVTWLQDMLPNLTCRRAGESMGPFDYAMGHGLMECVESFGYPAEQFMACQIPTNAATFHNSPCDDEDLAPYRCDFAYVGTGSTPPRAMHDEFIAKNNVSPDFVALLENVYARLEALMSADAGERFVQIGRVLREASAECGMTLNDETRSVIETNYLAVIADRLYRFQTLDWVVDFVESTGRSFKLYGAGWAQVPRFAKYALGRIENGEPLRRLYQAASINLHCNLHGSMHQRLLDGLSSGGFFLVRYQTGDFMYDTLRRRLAWMETIRDRIPVTVETAAHPALVESFDVQPPEMRARGYPPRFEVNPQNFQRARLNARVGRRSVASAIFADFERVTFADRDAFFARAEAFLRDVGTRRDVAATMREDVFGKLSYEGVMRELIGELAAHFKRTAVASSST